MPPWSVSVVAIMSIVVSCGSPEVTGQIGPPRSTGGSTMGSSAPADLRAECDEQRRPTPPPGTSPAGNTVQWMTDVGTGPATYPNLVDTDANGDILVFSETPEGAGSTAELLLERLSSEGARRWSTRIGTKASGVLAPAMAVAGDGSTIVAWTTIEQRRSVTLESDSSSPAAVANRVAIVTVARDGSVVDEVEIPHQHNAVLLDLNRSGSIVVVFDQGDGHPTVELWNRAGELEWSEQLPAVEFVPYVSGLVRSVAVRATSDGGVAVAGALADRDATREVAVSHLSAKGEIQWQITLPPFRSQVTDVSLHGLDGGFAVGAGNPDNAEEGSLLTYLACDGTILGESRLEVVNRIDALVGSMDRQTALGHFVHNEGFGSYLVPVRAGGHVGQPELRFVGGAVGEMGGWPGNFLNDIVGTSDGGLVIVGSVRTTTPGVEVPPRTARAMALRLGAPSGEGNLTGLPDIFGLESP